MDTCDRHRVELSGGADNDFCPFCEGEEADATYARGEETGDYSSLLFGVPAQPETLRPVRWRQRG
ncbi:MAG: hypothetical protein JWM80_3973 [Cyanobacteria bacterium RYN_339]|nr:hypothetical protein [Cyanobacteria bacterium RYN_339]